MLEVLITPRRTKLRKIILPQIRVSFEYGVLGLKKTGTYLLTPSISSSSYRSPVQAEEQVTKGKILVDID